MSRMLVCLPESRVHQHLLLVFKKKKIPNVSMLLYRFLDLMLHSFKCVNNMHQTSTPTRPRPRPHPAAAELTQPFCTKRGVDSVGAARCRQATRTMEWLKKKRMS